MPRSSRDLAIAMAFVAALIVKAGPAEGSGPWKGQIVDAETSQPISGAVVLAAWWKRSPGAVHERRDFHDAVEVVTDDQGRFVIPAVSTLSLNPFTRIQGPDIKIFKGGYGQWQFQGEPPILKSDVEQRKVWLEQAWSRFEGQGVVIELPPVKTKEERRKFRGLISPTLDIPSDRIREFRKALDMEDRWLGVR